jgi:hypothetical protein
VIFSSWSFPTSANRRALDRHYRSIGPYCQADASAGLPSDSFVAVETDFLDRAVPMCAEQELRRYGLIQVVDRIIKA